MAVAPHLFRPGRTGGKTVSRGGAGESAGGDVARVAGVVVKEVEDMLDIGVFQRLGFGAELGISTQKLHARGPMGAQALTTTKFLIDGDGQIR